MVEMKTGRASAVMLALAIACIVPRAADAQGAPSKAAVDEARARYERGIKLYEEGAYEGAQLEFERAYAVAPSYKILYNIGQARRQQSDYVGAARTFERYLVEGGKEIAVSRRADVEREIAEMKARVATLVVVTEPGVEISVDDAVVGKTPLDGARVNPGRRRITATKAGRPPITKTIVVASSDTAKVEFEFPAESSVPVAPPPVASAAPAPVPSSQPPPPPPAAPPPPQKTSTWVPWLATGVLATGATLTGILALSSSKSLTRDRQSFGTTSGDLSDGASRTRTLATVSDVLWVGTAVVGVTALYFTLKTPASDTAVRVDVGPSSVTARGSF